MDRRAAVSRLLGALPEALVVTGLGSPSYDAFAAGQRDTTFYLWGAMGGAVPLALGLALARPDRSVLAITGDGEQLMGIGSLATVAVAAPPNLTIVVLDNGHYGETGMQASHAGLGTDLAAVASGCGITHTLTIGDLDAVDDLAAVASGCGIARALTITDLDELGGLAEQADARDGTTFARLVIGQQETPRALPPRDGVANKNGFRGALGLATF